MPIRSHCLHKSTPLISIWRFITLNPENTGCILVFKVCEKVQNKSSQNTIQSFFEKFLVMSTHCKMPKHLTVYTTTRHSKMERGISQVFRP